MTLMTSYFPYSSSIGLEEEEEEEEEEEKEDFG